MVGRWLSVHSWPRPPLIPRGLPLSQKTCRVTTRKIFDRTGMAAAS